MWQFYFEGRFGWAKLDANANEEVNRALSQEDPPEEVATDHWWQRKSGKPEHTVYTINFAEMRQRSSDNKTTRAVYGQAMTNKKTKFDWVQFQQEKVRARSQVQAVELSPTVPAGEGGFWPDNRGGGLITGAVVHEVAWDCKTDGEVACVQENQQMVVPAGEGTGSQQSATADGEVVRACEWLEPGSQPRTTPTWLGPPYVTAAPATPVPSLGTQSKSAPKVPPSTPKVPLSLFLGTQYHDAPRKVIQSGYPCCSEPQLFRDMGDVGSQPMNDAGDGAPVAPPPPPAWLLGGEFPGEFPAAPPPIDAEPVRKNSKAAPTRP